MKTTLLLAAVVALMATAAAAVEMPEQLRYHAEESWCQVKTESRGAWQVVTLSPVVDNCKNPSDFAFTTDGFGWEDQGCKPIRVGNMGVKAPRGRTLEWAIVAQCDEDDAPSKIREFKFSLYQGAFLTLYMKRGPRR